MSEIKGQLLGMILVLALFAAVAGAMVSIFNRSTDKIAERVDQETSFVSTRK